MSTTSSSPRHPSAPVQPSSRTLTAFAPACRSVGAVLALLLCAGCANLPSTVPEFMARDGYQPEHSPTQIDAGATVEASVTQDAGIRNHLRSAGFSDAAIENHLQALNQVLVDDIVASGLFARIQPAGGIKADYLVKIRDEETHYPEWMMRVSITVIDPTTAQVLSSRTREMATGTMSYKECVPGIMAALKADVAADLLGRIQQRQALKEAAVFQNAALTDLLASSDKWVLVARERNRAIVAAKTRQLPEILRGRTTEELSTFVVRIEQTILDLNHECEVAKDRAQQSIAIPQETSGRDRAQPVDGGSGNSGADELRGLAISYRERIELLKPIAAAVREEIANRNR